MSAYQAPAWTQEPKGSWFLTEIKGGVETARHNLSSKSCLVLGRAAELVDVVLAHESCSRLHARIAFDGRGIPWLRDLGSTHGTMVNKRALPQEAVGKEEAVVSNKKGSRGVVLYSGDLLKFGASTRLFCLEGPPEFERGAMEIQEKLKQIHSKQEQQQPQEPEPEEVPPPSLSQLDISKVPEKHRKLFERFQAKQYKLANLETESDRIQAKGELTEGQEKQLQRNEERINILQKEMEDIEQELQENLFHQPQKEQQHKEQFAANDDDDVEDRTLDRRGGRLGTSKQAETEESLTQKWKDLHAQWVKQSLIVQQSQDKVSMLEQQQASTSQNDEDAFFLENDLNLAKDVLDKAKEQLQWIKEDWNETERLLRVVNEKLQFNRASGNILPLPFRMPPPPSGRNVMLPPPAVRPTMMPPPPSPVTTNATSKVKQSTCTPQRGAAMEPPPMKKPRVLGPAGPRPGGTLAFLSHSTETKTSGSNQQSKDSSKKTQQSGQESFDLKKDEWQAPKGQDGSGRTKLNAKFAGRY